MSRLNNIILYIVYQVNVFYSLIGLCFLGFGLYLIFADWGTLNPGFFVGAGVITGLFGFIICIISWLGCLGIDHQDKRQGILKKVLHILKYQISAFIFI